MVTIASLPRLDSRVTCFYRDHTDLSEAMYFKVRWLDSRGVLFLPPQPQPVWQGWGRAEEGKTGISRKSQQVKMLSLS